MLHFAVNGDSNGDNARAPQRNLFLNRRNRDRFAHVGVQNFWRASSTVNGRPQSAHRNMERAGLSRSVAMQLTGHKTEAVYRRYAITSEADLREGVDRLNTRSAGRSPAANTAWAVRNRDDLPARD